MKNKQLFSSILLLLLTIIIQLTSISCSFDVQLIRQEKIEPINFNEKANLDNISKCPLTHSQFTHNKYFTTILCHDYDVSYNMEFIMGDVNKKFHYFTLGLDLTSQYTWIKKDDCQRCKHDSTKYDILQRYQNKQQGASLKKADRAFNQCSQTCLFDGSFLNTITVQNEQITQDSMLIAEPENMVQGKFLIDSAILKVYNEEKTISLKDLYNYELKRDYEDSLKEVIEIDYFKVIYAMYMIGMDKYMADGGLGFGFIDKQHDDDNYIEQTNFIEQLSSRYKKQKLQNKFGLYMGEMCDYKPDFVVTLGGYSEEYSYSGIIDPIYISLLPAKERAQYWAVKLKTLRVGEWNSYDKNDIEANKIAVISTKASYIALPKDILTSFLAELNNQFKMDCSIVDNKIFAIYCKKITVKKVFTMQLEMEFHDSHPNVPIRLDAIDMFKNCEEKIENLKKDDNVDKKIDCVLNVRASRDDTIILGEPFLKQHYTLFDMQEKQIGLLPTINNNSFMDQFRRSLFQYFLRWATFSFIGLMLFVCFYKQLRRIYKDIRNTFRARSFRSEVSEIQGLTSKTHHLSQDGMNKSEMKQFKDDDEDDLDNEDFTNGDEENKLSKIKQQKLQQIQLKNDKIQNNQDLAIVDFDDDLKIEKNDINNNELIENANNVQSESNNPEENNDNNDQIDLLN